MQFEITLASTKDDLPQKGSIVVMQNGGEYFVSDLKKDGGVDGDEWTYTLTRIKWYHRAWWWIKRQWAKIKKYAIR